MQSSRCRVRWYVGGLGTENGMHNFHWHGNVLEMGGRFMDQVTAIPATTRTLDMVPDNPGRWFYHCHVGARGSGMPCGWRAVWLGRNCHNTAYCF